mmetsp:Transcript_22533/g.77119  ORF Transcript_22533/g.77119 Transcript_22533/m.77119 type:complete len:93 (+) Transcript_22533:71-349(+)
MDRSTRAAEWRECDLVLVETSRVDDVKRRVKSHCMQCVEWHTGLQIDGSRDWHTSFGSQLRQDEVLAMACVALPPSGVEHSCLGVPVVQGIP